MNSNPRMYTKMIFVTPELAAEWLKKNTRNRPLRQRHVDDIKRLIANGQLVTTHQGIAFYASDGALADGQHTLTAIVEGKTGVWRLVTWNLPDEAQFAIDMSPARTILDVLVLDGHPTLTARHNAVARRFALGVGTSAIRMKSVYDFRAVYEQHGELIKRTVATFMEAKLDRRFLHASVIAAFARAALHEKPEVLTEFLAVLKDGVAPSMEHIAVIKLRDFVMTQNSDRAPSIELYAKTEKAIWSFARKEVIKNLKASARELYPLPTVKTEPELQSVEEMSSVVVGNGKEHEAPILTA